MSYRRLSWAWYFVIVVAAQAASSSGATEAYVPQEIVRLYLGERVACVVCPIINAAIDAGPSVKRPFPALVCAVSVYSMTTLSIAAISAGLGGLGALVGYGIEKKIIDENTAFADSHGASVGATIVAFAIMASIFIRLSGDIVSGKTPN